MAEGFLKELGKVHVRPPLYSGSQSTIDFANNPVYHDSTKHIHVRYHFIHKLLKDSALSLKKIHTSQNPSDMLTKVVVVEKLKNCFAFVGLQG